MLDDGISKFVVIFGIWKHFSFLTSLISIYKRNGKFLSVSLGNFIKRKPLIPEECSTNKW